MARLQLTPDDRAAVERELVRARAEDQLSQSDYEARLDRLDRITTVAQANDLVRDLQGQPTLTPDGQALPPPPATRRESRVLVWVLVAVVPLMLLVLLGVVQEVKDNLRARDEPVGQPSDPPPGPAPSAPTAPGPDTWSADSFQEFTAALQAERGTSQVFAVQVDDELISASVPVAPGSRRWTTFHWPTTAEAEFANGGQGTVEAGTDTVAVADTWPVVHAARGAALTTGVELDGTVTLNASARHDAIITRNVCGEVSARTRSGGSLSIELGCNGRVLSRSVSP